MPKRRANGEGSLYQRQDGTWTAQYTDCTGKKRYLYGKTQQIVKDKLKTAIRQNDAGIAVEPKKVNFSDWVKEWLEVYHKPFVRGSTYGNNCGRWKNHIAPYFSKVQLKDIRPELLQRFFNEKIEQRFDGKAGGYSVSSCVQLKNVIYGALSKAVELGYIPSNPAEKIKLPPLTYAEKRIFTVEEQHRFEQRVRVEMEQDYNASIYILMLSTGLRIGEALGLKTGDLDFERKEMYVRRTVGVLWKVEGGVQFYVHDPKTRAGKRTIPLSGKVMRLLKVQLEQRDKMVEAMWGIWSEKGRDAEIINAGYLYMTNQGNVINKSNLDHRLERLLEEAAITPRVSLHGMRHTFATRWLEAGLDVRTLAEILGHSDVKMTLNIYTHSLPEQRRKNMDAIAAYMGDGEN